MEISEIQSQLAFNRKAINELHQEEKYVKRCAQYYYERQCQAAGDNLMKILTSTKKQIAKLVLLQKALKADMTEELEWNSFERKMSEEYKKAHNG